MSSGPASPGAFSCGASALAHPEPSAAGWPSGSAPGSGPRSRPFFWSDSKEQGVSTGPGQQWTAPQSGQSASAVMRGKKTGKSPVDRARPGSKHVALVASPEAVIVTAIAEAGNRNDRMTVEALLDAVPPVRRPGRKGRPRKRFREIYADRGYDSPNVREAIRRRGGKPYVARCGQAHGSGLGKVRWVAEQGLATLHNCRRLLVRFDRGAFLHQAFLDLSVVLASWTKLTR